MNVLLIAIIEIGTSYNDELSNITKSALQYAKAVEELVAAKVRNGRAQDIGGEEVAKRIFALNAKMSGL
jgi:hypothetical protein